MDKWEQIAQIRSDRIEELEERRDELLNRVKQRDQVIEQYKTLVENLFEERGKNV